MVFEHKENSFVQPRPIYANLSLALWATDLPNLIVKSLWMEPVNKSPMRSCMNKLGLA